MNGSENTGSRKTGIEKTGRKKTESEKTGSKTTRSTSFCRKLISKGLRSMTRIGRWSELRAIVRSADGFPWEGGRVRKFS